MHFYIKNSLIYTIYVCVFLLLIYNIYIIYIMIFNHQYIFTYHISYYISIYVRIISYTRNIIYIYNIYMQMDQFFTNLFHPLEPSHHRHHYPENFPILLQQAPLVLPTVAHPVPFHQPLLQAFVRP